MNELFKFDCTEISNTGNIKYHNFYDDTVSSCSTFQVESNKFIITYNFPGCDKNDISGEIRDKKTLIFKSKEYRYVTPISNEYDLKEIKAKVKNGKLTVTVPKKKPEMPCEITIDNE